MRLLSFLFLIVVFLPGCRKEKPQSVIFNAGSGAVLVLNEGNFMWSNSGVDLYDMGSGKLLSGIYQSVNGKPLGDVLQSGSIINGDVWLVVNNSGKIVVLDSHTLKEKYTISGLRSPRYVAQAANRIWITDLYSGKVQIRDATGKTLLHEIPVGVWSEHLVNDGKGMCVAGYDGWIRRYDTMQFQLMDSLYLGKGLRWMVKDQQQSLWALASNSDSGYCRLLKVNAARTWKKRFDFPLTTYASSLAISKNKDTVFYLADGVYAMNVNALSLPQTPILKKANCNFYALACHPKTGVLFVSDAKDYVSRGMVQMLHGNGTPVGSFSAGIIPSGFIFY